VDEEGDLGEGEHGGGGALRCLRWLFGGGGWGEGELRLS
jgi:hypothetical protein